MSEDAARYVREQRGVGGHRTVVVAHEVCVPGHSEAFEDNIERPFREVSLAGDHSGGYAFAEGLSGGFIADAGGKVRLVLDGDFLAGNEYGFRAIADTSGMASIGIGDHHRAGSRPRRAPAGIGEGLGRYAIITDSLAGDFLPIGVDMSFQLIAALFSLR